jgi:transposase-like protein
MEGLACLGDLYRLCLAAMGIRGENEMKHPKTLQEAIVYFSDPDRSLDYMANLRWADGVTCPTCGRKDVVFLKNQRKWQCKSVHPKRQFSAKIGTIFEDSPISLDKWLTAVWMICNCKNGVSSYELSRTIGVTQKSAWFMLHRIRLALKSGSILKMGGSGTPVEADETYIGGKVKNMHKKRILEIVRKRNAIPDWQATVSNRYYGKVPVAGLLDRESRKVRATVVPNVRRGTLQKHIIDHVKPDSAIFTDQHLGRETVRA